MRALVCSMEEGSRCQCCAAILTLLRTGSQYNMALNFGILNHQFQVSTSIDTKVASLGAAGPWRELGTVGGALGF